MSPKILNQIKRVIMANKTVERDISLSLSQKRQLKKLSKRIRNNKGIDDITFDEFILICKYTKLKAELIIYNGHVTRIVDILSFNELTLKNILNNIIRDIIVYNEMYKYPTIQFNLVRCSLARIYSISFEEFTAWCDKLNINIRIE